MTAEAPPGPPLPRWAQTLAFAAAGRPFTDACRRRYGEMVRFRTLFGPPSVVVFEPELVKHVFQGSAAQLGSGMRRLEPLVGSQSLLVLEGAEHLRRRRLLLPAFHGDRLRAQVAEMQSATDRAVDAWPVGEPFALLPWMQSLTLDVIIAGLFGPDVEPRREALKRGLRDMLDPRSGPRTRLLPALTGGRLGDDGSFERRRRRSDERIRAEITRRRAAPDPPREDVLSTLLAARDEDGTGLTDEAVRDELVTLALAGHETTASALTWAFELLHRNPDVLARLRHSLAVGDEAYLQAVIRETLRVRPVVRGAGRTVRSSPFPVGGRLVAAGEQIHFSITGLHRRVDRYPEPERFRPERFLEADAPDGHAWIPFGGGERRCLGASFAMLEMSTVIGRVLERTSLEPAGRRPEAPARRGLVTVPRRGARVVQLRAPRPAVR